MMITMPLVYLPLMKDDAWTRSLCKAPSGSIGAQEGLTALDLDGDDDEDDEEDVALVAPALLPRF